MKELMTTSAFALVLAVLGGCEPDEPYAMEVLAEDDASVMAMFTEPIWVDETASETLTLDLEEDNQAADSANTCNEVDHVVRGGANAYDEEIGTHSVGFGGCYAEGVEGYVTGTLAGGEFGDETTVTGRFVLAEQEEDYGPDLHEPPFDVTLTLESSGETLTGALNDVGTLVLTGADLDLLFQPAP